MKSQTLYIVIVSLIAFFVWIAGEAVIILSDLSMSIARIWVIAVFSLACIWSIIHFYRKDQKAKEDEANDNYKGVY